MAIQFFQRSNFGADPRIYIEDGVTARQLEQLTGRKTYTVRDLQILSGFGAEFVEVPDPRRPVVPSWRIAKQLEAVDGPGTWFKS
jgi:hypothetical protein